MKNIYSNSTQITYSATASVFFLMVNFKIKMILVHSLFWKQNGDTFLLSTLFSKKKIQPIHTGPIIRLKWRPFSIL